MAFRARLYLETKEKGVFTPSHAKEALACLDQGLHPDASFIEVIGDEQIDRGNLLHLAARLSDLAISVYRPLLKRVLEAKHISLAMLEHEPDVSGNIPLDLACTKYCMLKLMKAVKLTLSKSNGLHLWTSKVAPEEARTMLRSLAWNGLSLPQAAVEACNNMPCRVEIVRAGGMPFTDGLRPLELNVLQSTASRRNSAERVLRNGMQRRLAYLPRGYKAQLAKMRFELTQADVTKLSLEVAPEETTEETVEET